MKILASIAVVFLMSTTFIHESAADWSASGVTGEITMLFVKSNKDVLIKVDATNSPTNCTLISGNYIELDAANANRDDIYKTLLAAELAGRTIFIRTNDSGNCVVNYIKMGSDIG